MPMVNKNLETLHRELMDIARQSNKLSYAKYSADDIEKLQDRLRVVDSQYREGCFNQSSYEEEGSAQVSDELEKVHNTLHRMLSRLD